MLYILFTVAYLSFYIFNKLYVLNSILLFSIINLCNCVYVWVWREYLKLRGIDGVWEGKPLGSVDLVNLP